VKNQLAVGHFFHYLTKNVALSWNYGYHSSFSITWTCLCDALRQKAPYGLRPFQVTSSLCSRMVFKITEDKNDKLLSLTSLSRHHVRLALIHYFSPFILSFVSVT
jgi:hypothetical protein